MFCACLVLALGAWLYMAVHARACLEVDAVRLNQDRAAVFEQNMLATIAI